MFAEYIEWRATHPSDDLMTELLNAEIEEAGRNPPPARTHRGARVHRDDRRRGQRDHRAADRLHGPTSRRTSRPTARARRGPVADPVGGRGDAALRAAVAGAGALRRRRRRASTGRPWPKGPTCCCSTGRPTATRRSSPTPTATTSTATGGHLSFGQGLHFCLGSALARLEGRVAFEEVLKRWTDWDVDYRNASRAHTSSVRGWAELPVKTGSAETNHRHCRCRTPATCESNRRR